MKSTRSLQIWALSLLSTATPGLVSAQLPPDYHSFDWEAVEPTPDLQYHDCYDEYKCARLLVPLDWSQANTTDEADATAAIAVIMAPAVVPESDPTFGGTIIVNFGGPFVSGIGVLPTARDVLRPEFDSPGKKHFEILSFDTRGVAFSTPKADCYLGENFKRYASKAETRAYPNPAQQPEALHLYYQNALAYGELCAQASEAQGDESVFPHMSTATNARDMLEIVNRVDELRRKNNGDDEDDASDEDEETPLPRLLYYGISGGSMLGNVFASMFPDRVGRLVIDAITDGEHWFDGTYMEFALQDADDAFDRVWENCFNMGSDCVLYEPSDTKPKDIGKRVEKIWRDFQDNPPVVVYNGRIHQFPVEEFSFQMLASATFSPDFPNQVPGEAVMAMVEGNWTARLPELTDVFELLDGEDTCEVRQGRGVMIPGYTWDENVFHGTTCSDAFYGSAANDEEFVRGLFERLDKKLPLMGRAYANWAIKCVGWQIEPQYPFIGPVGSPAPDEDLREAGEVAPLLILSTRSDPSTPLAAAYRTSAAHGDSAVVVTEIAGHGALMKSGCLREIVRAYFDEGTMPANDTSCPGGFPDLEGEDGGPVVRSQLMTRNLF